MFQSLALEVASLERGENLDPLVEFTETKWSRNHAEVGINTMKCDNNKHTDRKYLSNYNYIIYI